MPEIVNKDEKDVEKKRETAKEAAARQQQTAEMGVMANSAKQIGEIPLDKAHVGGAIAEGLK